MSAHCGRARGPRYWMAALKHALSAGERSRVPHRVPEDPSRERTHFLKSKDLHDTHHVCPPLFYPVLFLSLCLLCSNSHARTRVRRFLFVKFEAPAA